MYRNWKPAEDLELGVQWFDRKKESYMQCNKVNSSWNDSPEEEWGVICSSTDMGKSYTLVQRDSVSEFADDLASKTNRIYGIDFAPTKSESEAIRRIEDIKVESLGL